MWGDKAAADQVDKPYTLSVSEEAAAVASEVGVDLERLVVVSADKVLARVPFEGKIKIEVEANSDHVVPEVGTAAPLIRGRAMSSW